MMHLILIIVVIFLIALNLLIGSVSIPADQVFAALMGQPVEKASWAYIVVESRLPQAITALLCGSSLAAAGLLLQTAFRNPLAGPSILGITSGASLGAALVMHLTGGIIGTGISLGGQELQLTGFVAIMVGSLIGAMAIIALLLAISSMVRSNVMLLIVGIMVSYLTSSVVSLLNFFANADSIQSYVLWGMGSFSDVTLKQLPWFAGATLIGLTLAVLLIKPLNALLLGDNYAENLGINVRRTNRLVLLTTGMLTATSTAFCGPVAFIGLAVPHIARLITRTTNHLRLLPSTILIGAIVALLCNLLCILPSDIILPLNAVTPLFGAPVILYIILLRKQ